MSRSTPQPLTKHWPIWAWARALPACANLTQMASALSQSLRAAAASASANGSGGSLDPAASPTEEDGLRRIMRFLQATAQILQLRQLGQKASLIIETAHVEE